VLNPLCQNLRLDAASKKPGCKKDAVTCCLQALPSAEQSRTERLTLVIHLLLNKWDFIYETGF